MKKITLLLFLITFCFNANSQSTINVTTSGGSYATEKWVSITTEVDGGGTQVWGQGDGTYGNGSGLINQDIDLPPGTYYVNCYDLYSDGWDDTLISVTAYGSVIGDNGGESPSDSSTNDTDGTWETPADELEASFMIVVTEAPSCSLPSGLTLDAATNTTATISWTAGGTETAWEYIVEAYGSDEPSTGGVSTTSNPLTLSGLTANTPYDVYVRADCSSGDFSNWVKISFSTDCDITNEALSHNFDTLDNNNLVVDASCWSVVNGDGANTWGLVQNSTTLNIYWRLKWDSTAHDDYLYSPVITVLDGVTDGFNFKGWSTSATYIESIDLLVVDPDNNSVIATLESDLQLPNLDTETGATRFTYDLSAYEGQDVKIGFHSATTDLFYAHLDEFTLDAFSTLGTATNTLEGFTLYPTIVKEELNFRSQNKVEAITVFNLLGQKVFSGAPNTNNSSINLSNLRPGVYIVKVSAEGKIGSYKIIKE